MKYPKVSIIIINWNGLKDTIECLESLKKITYPNYEIVLVDNASENYEGKALKKNFSDYIVLIQNEKNFGFTGANNAGINYALKNDADYVLLLNNDVIVDKRFVDELIFTFSIFNNVGIVGTAIYNYYDKKKISSLGIQKNFFNIYYGVFKEIKSASSVDNRYKVQRMNNFFIKPDLIVGCSIMFTSDLVRKIGFFDEDYFFMNEDSDYCLRAKKAGFGLYVNPEAKIWHKIASSTQNASAIREYYGRRNLLLLIKKQGNIFELIYNYLFYILLLPKYFLDLKINKSSMAKARIDAFFDAISGRFGKKIS